MKKLSLILLSILALSVSACSMDFSFNGEGNSNSNNSNNSGSNNNTINYTEEIKTDNVDESTLKWLTIDSSLDTEGRYSSGNYGTTTLSGFTLDYYRTVNLQDGNALKILGSSFKYLDGGLPGSLTNVTPIYDIRRIKINFTASEGLQLRTYNDVSKPSLINLGKSGTDREIKIAEGTCFFAFECESGNAKILNAQIGYSNKSTSYKKTYTYSETRAANRTYDQTLVDGVSKVTLPDSTGKNKEYTYYSTSYAIANLTPSEIEANTYIDIVDVCNYIQAFKTFPINYLDESDLSLYRSEFGTKTREVSEYYRTNGYVNAVPCRNKGASNFVYYELDVDIDGNYRTSSRGVGRIVTWLEGFTCYEEGPVSVYTDDHYATFQEYNNKGGFSPRFNAQMDIAHANYCPLETR